MTRNSTQTQPFFIRLIKIIGLILLALTMNLIPLTLNANAKVIPIWLQWLLGIAYLGLAGVVIYYLWRAFRKTDSLEIKSLKFGWREVGIALLFFLAGRFIAVLGTLLIQIFLGTPTSANDAALMASNDQLLSLPFIYVLNFHLMLGLIAPIIEELVFRGFMSKYFFRNNNWALAIMSSLVFALMHAAQPLEILMYFALGLVFFFAFRRRGDIRESILVHILNNSLLVILSFASYILLLLQ